MAAGELETREHNGTYDVPQDAPAYLLDAMQDIGLQEYVIKKGQKVSNPIVERFSEKATGKKYDAIKYPWCAFWVGAKLEYNGITCTKSGMARSYLKWGDDVDHEDAQPGDIVVTWRGKKDDGVTGHVFFFLEWNEDGSVKGIGANQADSVSVADFQSRKILGIRRPRGLMKSKTMRSTLGSAGAEGMSKLVDMTVPDAPSKVDNAMSFLDQLQSPLQALSHIKPQLKVALEMIAIALVLYAAYCRFNDHTSGKNT